MAANTNPPDVDYSSTAEMITRSEHDIPSRSKRIQIADIASGVVVPVSGSVTTSITSAAVSITASTITLPVSGSVSAAITSSITLPVSGTVGVTAGAALPVSGSVSTSITATSVTFPVSGSVSASLTASSVTLAVSAASPLPVSGTISTTVAQLNKNYVKDAVVGSIPASTGSALDLTVTMVVGGLYEITVADTTGAHLEFYGTTGGTPRLFSTGPGFYGTLQFTAPASTTTIAVRANAAIAPDSSGYLTYSLFRVQ